MLGPWRILHLIAVAAVLATVVWLQWAKRYRQYRHPRQDTQLAEWLTHWFTDLPWGPARGTLTVAVVGLEAWRSGAVTSLANYFAWGVGLTAGLSVAAVGLTHVTVKRLFWSEWVATLHKALCGELSDKELKRVGWQPSDRRPGKHIRIARDWQHHKRRWWFSRHGDGIAVMFPDELRLGENHLDSLRSTIVDVLGLRDVDHEWKPLGHFSMIRFLPAQVVPEKARFRNPDIRAAIETKLAELPTAPVLALGRGDAPIAIDIDAEAPHILISAGTIGGKSVTVRNIVAQLLWADNQAIAVIVDAKEQSQRGLAAVPGVAVARSGEEINNALVAVLDEIRRRNAICRDISLGEPMPRFPRIVLGLEEMNDTEKVLKDWWRSSGHHRGLPPGLYALSSILCTGRAVRVNVVLVAQQANVKTTGGGEGRANIAVRILAEYGVNEWNMLAHGADYIPAISHKQQPGWCVIVHGRDVQEGQRIMITDEQAHAWLTQHPRPLATTNLHAALPALSVRPPQAPEADNTPSGFVVATARTSSMQEIASAGVVAATDGEVDYVTLRELVEDGSVPMTLVALQRASQRSAEFPPAVRMPDGYQYSKRAVLKFLEERPHRRRIRPTKGWVYALVGGGVPYLGGQVKVGYTTRDPRTRAKEIAPYRPEDIVKLVEVAHPPDGEQLPDKAWHRKFHGYVVHEGDETSELFWIRGEVAVWLGVREEVRA